MTSFTRERVNRLPLPIPKPLIRHRISPPVVTYVLRRQHPPIPFKLGRSRRRGINPFIPRYNIFPLCPIFTCDLAAFTALTSLSARFACVVLPILCVIEFPGVG